MKDIDNLHDKDLDCEYRYIRYLVLFYPDENETYPGLRVVIKCNINTSASIIVYSETSMMVVGTRKIRSVINSEEFVNLENVFKTYSNALNYYPAKAAREIPMEVKEERKDIDLKCPMSRKRYIVLYYCGPQMVTHQRQIIKFCMDTGRGVICHDDMFENNEGRIKKVIVPKDVDSRENIFKAYSKASKYILSEEMICPSSGAFEAYSVGVCKDGTYTIIKLRIPVEAERLSVFMERTCRCNCAEVLSITSLDGSQVMKCKDLWYSDLKYKVGKVTKVKNFDSDRRHDGEGIIFFMTQEEALRYAGR